MSKMTKKKLRKVEKSETEEEVTEATTDEYDDGYGLLAASVPIKIKKKKKKGRRLFLERRLILKTEEDQEGPVPDLVTDNDTD